MSQNTELHWHKTATHKTMLAIQYIVNWYHSPAGKEKYNYNVYRKSNYIAVCLHLPGFSKLKAFDSSSELILLIVGAGT